MGPRLASNKDGEWLVKIEFACSASMGPRLASRGCLLHRLTLDIYGPLQWGRGSRAADALGHRSRIALRVPSMGPRLASRGCRRSWNESPLWKTFNGAAAREPRMRSISPSRSYRSMALQWGRGSRAADAGTTTFGAFAPATFNGAAAREPRMLSFLGGIFGGGKPSMGPRLASRGCRSRQSGRSSSAGLQWGRGSRAADAPGIRRRRARVDSSFNGAAAREPRMPIRTAFCRVGDIPSMGPRLASRGCDTGTADQFAATAPSMGPRLASRGCALYRHRRRRAAAPSMGPRLASRGCFTFSNANGISFGLLQWGRGSRAADACHGSKTQRI